MSDVMPLCFNALLNALLADLAFADYLGPQVCGDNKGSWGS